MIHRLVLNGRVPGKKDNMHPRADRKGYYLDPRDAADIQALMWQARSQWAGRGAIQETRNIVASFSVLNGRSDLDSKYTTTQDLLVKARVLQNDSIARVKRFSTSAEISDVEAVVIEIED